MTTWGYSRKVPDGYTYATINKNTGSHMHLGSLIPVGTNLKRPECVLAHQSGLLFTADWTGNGGVSIIAPSGRCHKLLVSNNHFPIRPNGIALDACGDLLLAHLGENDGGVYRLKANGQLEPVVLTANGQPLPPTNYIVHDSEGRLWITVSTRMTPRALDYRASANTGFIAVLEPGSSDANIVADNLGYTNECVVDLNTSTVFVNETFARQLSRFELTSNGTLTNKSCVTTFTAGTYPDGVACDTDGNFWISSIVSNRIIKVSATGEQQLVLEDCDSAHVQRCEEAYLNNQLGREHLDTAHSQILKNSSSIAFGGEQLQSAYIGNLLGDCIHSTTLNAQGVPLPHWNVPLGPLERYLD